MESSQPKSYRGGSDLASSLKILLQTKTSTADPGQSLISWNLMLKFSSIVWQLGTQEINYLIPLLSRSKGLKNVIYDTLLNQNDAESEEYSDYFV